MPAIRDITLATKGTERAMRLATLTLITQEETPK